VDLELRRGHEALSPVRLAVAFALVLSGCAPSEAPPRGTLFFGGDVMFGRLLPEGFRPYDTLPARPRDAADLAVVNLETALCDPDALERDALAAQRHLLVAPTAKARRLRDAGVDVAVVANNHALDCGAESLERTLRALDAVGIVSVGARTRGDGSFPTVVVERPWGEVVITAATMHPSPIPSSSLVPAVLFERDRDAWLDHVRALRARHLDALLVVSLHWGAEGRVRPLGEQRALAKELARAGVDVIFGHGSHTRQPVERMGETVAIFGAGNLHFDSREEHGMIEIAVVRDGARPRIAAIRAEGEAPPRHGRRLQSSPAWGK